MVSRASSLFFDTTQSWRAIADTNCACETLRPDQCENVSLPLVSTLSSLLRHHKLFGLYVLRLVTNVRNKCQIPCCDGDGCIKKIFRTSANIATHAQDAPAAGSTTPEYYSNDVNTQLRNLQLVLYISNETWTCFMWIGIPGVICPSRPWILAFLGSRRGLCSSHQRLSARTYSNPGQTSFRYPFTDNRGVDLMRIMERNVLSHHSRVLFAPLKIILKPNTIRVRM